MDSDRKSQLREVLRLFERAEQKVKEVERLSHELAVPSINELRYVGYHLTRALCEEAPHAIAEEIAKAKRHCQRAIYDAHEIGIIFLLEGIRSVHQRYERSTHLILEIVPEYIDILTNAENAKEFISRISEEHTQNRETYYIECEPHYLALKDAFRRLTAAVPLIDDKFSRAARSNQKKARQFIIGALLTAASICISALALIG